MTVTLVNVPNVPIVGTGTYVLASGEATFSQEDLADAVAAAHDPSLPAPRLKIGHFDPRFNEAVQSLEEAVLSSLDGEPAFGTARNLQLAANGQEITADYVDVPDWLAATLQSSYPGRSVEALRNFTAASGRTYRMVITAVALLGSVWPGVTSLDDLREVIERNGGAPEPVAAGEGFDHADGHADQFIIARVRRAGDAEERPRGGVDVAGMDLGNVRDQFLGDLDSGEVPSVPSDQPQADDIGDRYWWWPRSIRVEDDGTLCLIVDDDAGHLIRIPFTVEQGDLIYGQPQLVLEQYVPVTSDPDESGQPVAASAARVLASWPTTIRAARPSTTPTEVSTMRLNGVDVDTAALRTRLGLADDATEQAIADALGITLEASEAETAPEAPAEQEREPVAASGREIPEGMRLVDADTLAMLQAGAQTAQELAAERNRAERDRTVQAAIEQGRIPVAARQRYLERWDRDTDGTRTLLTASAADGGLAPGLIPVGRHEVGQASDGDGQPAAIEAEHEAFMARQFPNEYARLRGGSNGRTRIRQEA